MSSSWRLVSGQNHNSSQVSTFRPTRIKNARFLQYHLENGALRFYWYLYDHNIPLSCLSSCQINVCGTHHHQALLTCRVFRRSCSHYYLPLSREIPGEHQVSPGLVSPDAVPGINTGTSVARVLINSHSCSSLSHCSEFDAPLRIHMEDRHRGIDEDKNPRAAITTSARSQAQLSETAKNAWFSY